MDEEDLAELRDSQKLVDTTEEMDLDFWEKKKADGAGEGSESVNIYSNIGTCAYDSLQLNHQCPRSCSPTCP